jgi:DNA mismatch endonuclease (patch repair protein)
MSRIRSTRTGPELKIKTTMRALGFKYQPKLYGRPDFASKKLKTVIFIDGCFWHKCPKHFKSAKSNRHYWTQKINNNVKRDKTINKYYKGLGWNIIRIWEHEIKSGAFKKKLRGKIGIYIN